MSESHLSLTRPSPGVVLVTLDHPDQRNAMTAPMTQAWSDLMADLRDDRDVRVLVVTGAGSAFCSGGDTSWIASEPDATVADLRARMLPFYRAWLSVLELDVPTIAAVNGPAIGAGLCLALACDLRDAATGARFAAPFVRLGMHPGMAATWLLPHVVRPAHARDLLLTRRTVGADEGLPLRLGSAVGADGALRLGLVSAVEEQERFLDTVLATADGIAATAPVASRLTTRALRGGGHADLGSALAWEALAQPVTLATDDLQEGVRAARERRIPRFSGR